jgi:N-acetylmuramoyl-L-alanine amidase
MKSKGICYSAMTQPTLFFRGAIAFLAATSFWANTTGKAGAQDFNKVEIDQSKVIVISTQLRQKYALTLIRQLTDTRSCWSETNSGQPVIVKLDLLEFDFTGICQRSVDSGGYSIRMADRDLGLDYKVEVLNRDGNLVLVGTPYSPNFPELIIGQTHGISGEPLKFFLNPGWRITQRSYEDQILGHYYFTHDLSPESVQARQ